MLSSSYLWMSSRGGSIYCFISVWFSGNNSLCWSFLFLLCFFGRSWFVGVLFFGNSSTLNFKFFPFFFLVIHSHRDVTRWWRLNSREDIIFDFPEVYLLCYVLLLSINKCMNFLVSSELAARAIWVTFLGLTQTAISIGPFSLD